MVDSNCLDTEEALKFLASIGDCELCVGATPKFKVHVHSDSPHKVLKYFLEKGQISEVFIHNMQIQSEDRIEKLNHDEEEIDTSKPKKELGLVAVAAGEGNTKILKSLGVDVVVSGGQTMNPSTKDLADAAIKAHAKKVIFLPNNKNIILAAKSACDVLEFDAKVLETKDVPSAFAALMAFDATCSIEENIENMSEAFEDLDIAEVTFAIKDSKDAYNNPIKEGDCIGISAGKIEVVGKEVEDVTMQLLKRLGADEKDMLTILAGSDINSSDFEKLVSHIEEKYEDLEIDSQDGGQPLYPIIFSLE